MIAIFAIRGQKDLVIPPSWLYTKLCEMKLSTCSGLLRDFFNSLLPSNSKQFWKVVKLVNKQHTQIPPLYFEQSEATTHREKADMLNSFFSKCWNYSIAPLHNQAKIYFDCSSICPDYLLCTIEEVIHLIKGLDTSKSNGPDGISAQMLKSTALSIAPSLTQLSTFQFQTVTFQILGKMLLFQNL